MKNEILQFPKVKYVYQNHHIDSLRWNYYKPRDNDIIISTGFKSGTTWLQMIIACLIFQNEEIQWPLQKLSPWVELVWVPANKVIANIELQRNRRFLKTHLPLDGIPYYHQVKYIVVSRDFRDIAMSLWNHYTNYTEEIYYRFNTLPKCPDNINQFWKDIMTRGWFEWENDGYPFWGIMRHLRTWWEFKHLKNILFIHYNDLLENIENEILKIADFLNIPILPNRINSIIERTSFFEMKKNAAKIWKDPSKTWKYGGDTFFFQAVNGRWKLLFSEAEMLQYENSISTILVEDCRQWVERG